LGYYLAPRYDIVRAIGMLVDVQRRCGRYVRELDCVVERAACGHIAAQVHINCCVARNRSANNATMRWIHITAGAGVEAGQSPACVVGEPIRVGRISDEDHCQLADRRPGVYERSFPTGGVTRVRYRAVISRKLGSASRWSRWR